MSVADRYDVGVHECGTEGADSDFSHIQTALYNAYEAAKNKLGCSRRELAADHDNRVERPDGNHRRLPSCSVLCQNIAPGHCGVIYWQCQGYRRDLQEEHDIIIEDGEENKVQDAIVVEQSLRGAQRNLSGLNGGTPTPFVRAETGFWNHAHTSEGSAVEFCESLKDNFLEEYEIAMEAESDNIVSSGCTQLWDYDDDLELGCVYFG